MSTLRFQQLIEKDEGATTESILTEIVQCSRVFELGNRTVIDYLVKYGQDIDNDMYLDPYAILLFHGHLEQATRLRNLFEITPYQRLSINTLGSIISAEGLRLFLDETLEYLDSRYYNQMLFNLLYIVKHDSQDIIHCILTHCENAEYILWLLVNKLADNNLPHILTYHDHLAFRQVRDYFQKDYYPNMPMEDNCYLNRLVLRFPQHYHKLRGENGLHYYLTRDEEPFVEEHFGTTLNDFLDLHRFPIDNIEHQCMVCMDTIITNPIQCCVSERFSEGHTFCEHCLRQWLKPECRNCPACRSELL